MNEGNTSIRMHEAQTVKYSCKEKKSQQIVACKGLRQFLIEAINMRKIEKQKRKKENAARETLELLMNFQLGSKLQTIPLIERLTVQFSAVGSKNLHHAYYLIVAHKIVCIL